MCVAAGKTHLAHDEAVPANDNVVRDVHEIINLWCPGR